MEERNCTMDRKPSFPSRRAFTLVEVLVALVIAVAMAVGIVTFLVFNFTFQNQEELRAGAMDAMVREMEKLRNKFLFNVDPYKVRISDNRTPDNPDDDTIALLTVRMFDRYGNEYNRPPMTMDRVRVVMEATWRGKGRLSSQQYHETLACYMIP
jgi:prepilin-type N-terminal cleavage/methylation domain-containing protein